MNKKAVSPLVATILLIAFAVSVGAIVMNWASGVSAAGNIGVCERLSLTITDQGNDICLDRVENKIRIVVENGPEDIDGFRISYLGGTSNVVDHVFAIGAGAIERIELPYNVAANGNPEKIKVIPFVKNNNDRIYCTESGQSFESIPSCS